MGRPLTDKWMGNRNNKNNPVLTPYCNILGTQGYCYILRQIGSNKFIVQNISDPTLIGQITLNPSGSGNPGEGYIAWQTDLTSGYAVRISDNTLRTVGGGNIPWTIYPGGQTETTAYISFNSDD